MQERVGNSSRSGKPTFHPRRICRVCYELAKPLFGSNSLAMFLNVTLARLDGRLLDIRILLPLKIGHACARDVPQELDSKGTRKNE